MQIDYLVNGLMLRPNREDWRLHFYDEVNALGDKYHQSNFHHWETDRLKVKLWDEEKKMSALIEFNRLFCILENMEREDEFLTVVQGLAKDYCEAMELKSLLHLGLSRTAIVHVKESFGNVVKKLQPKLYPKDTALDAVLGKEYSDVAFVNEFQRYGFMCNLNIGPVKKQEIMQKLEEKSFFIKQAKLPDTAIWIELRLQQTNPQVNGLSNFIDTSWSRSKEMITNLANYCIN